MGAFIATTVFRLVDVIVEKVNLRGIFIHVSTTKKQSLGKQYGFIFTLVIILFTVSVMVTYLLLDDTNQSIDETEETNAIVVEVNKWMSLYQEKYVFIPEYIIEESEQRLLDYLSLSSEFVNQAKRVRPLFSTEEQVQAFNQILNNNH